MPGNETPADTLDAIGLLCPEPLFQARTAIDALQPGEVLEVLADDPAAEEDLTRFAKRVRSSSAAGSSASTSSTSPGWSASIAVRA